MKKELWLSDIECTGCGACENACPKDVLKIELASSGHLYPRAYDGCIGCGRCEGVCNARLTLPARGVDRPTIYATWTKDPELRFSSTSGGAFTELSRVVLAHGGIVYGASYGSNCIVRHSSAENEGDLAELRQSKYVQSEIGLIFRSIRAEVEAGREVLFCGAPCQVAGLRAFLSADYDGLYLVDFFCLGVNSTKAYDAWRYELESVRGSAISRIWFKYKLGGWKSSPRRTRIDFENGDTIIQDGSSNHFMEGYLDFNLYLRPSCSKCDFKGFPRQGDLTVADFWGLDSAIDDDKGTSMVMVDNDKGERLYKEACANLVSYERPFEEIFAKNARIAESASLNPKSQDFLDALDSMGFESAFKRYARRSLWKRIRRMLGKAKRMFQGV